MKKIIILVVIIICLPAFAFAGEIYGNIKIENIPIGSGIKVEIEFNENSIYVDSTDRYSSYSIYVEETGECKLTVYYGEEVLSINVFSYQDSVRYNLIIIQKEGKYLIRRQ